ncbi:hypothetical protein VNO77_42308 [Canavalia gladiata]|uniref:Uncharacterized protein n=1 Tax=Canavalia gladiata TaxID=3824 RepID=A0AAN9PSQ4_CANGL
MWDRTVDAKFSVGRLTTKWCHCIGHNPQDYFVVRFWRGHFSRNYMHNCMLSYICMHTILSSRCEELVTYPGPYSSAITPLALLDGSPRGPGRCGAHVLWKAFPRSMGTSHGLLGLADKCGQLCMARF